MIPCLPLGGGEDQDKDSCDQEDFGSEEESPWSLGAPRSDSPHPGSHATSQLWRDPIQPPNAMHFSEQQLRDQTPVLPQSLQEGNQPTPWEPDYEKALTARAGNYGPGNSSSFRTIWHPSFCALYGAQSHDTQSVAPLQVEGNRESSQSDEGFPALCSEDFFFSDPLIPSITRIPIDLSQSPQQILRRSRQLLVPPPIMSSWTQPTPATILTWQSGPEITAVTSLLEMSQGETESAPLQSPP